jgi:CRP/FNR family transcriptional regulator, cyclic AMP receptor protein
MEQQFREDSLLEFNEGDCIFREGDRSQEMFIVQSGAVEIVKESGEGNLVLARLERGDFLGEMSLLESLPRSATAIARGKTRLLVIQPGGFLLKIRRDPTFAFELLQSLSRRIRTTNERLISGAKEGHVHESVVRDILNKEAA